MASEPDKIVHDTNESMRVTEAVINVRHELQYLPPNHKIEYLLEQGRRLLNRVWEAHARIRPTEWNPDSLQMDVPTDMRQYVHLIQDILPLCTAKITMYMHHVPPAYTLQTCVVTRITIHIISLTPFKTVEYDAGKTFLTNIFYPETRTRHTVQCEWAPTAISCA